MARERADAILVEPGQRAFAFRARIAELAVKNRLPTMGPVEWLVEAGCLMVYGPNSVANFRRAASRFHSRCCCGWIGSLSRRRCPTLRSDGLTRAFLASAAGRKRYAPVSNPGRNQFSTANPGMRRKCHATRFALGSLAPVMPVQISTDVRADIAKEPRGADAMRHRIFSWPGSSFRRASTMQVSRRYLTA